MLRFGLLFWELQISLNLFPKQVAQRNTAFQLYSHSPVWAHELRATKLCWLIAYIEPWWGINSWVRNNNLNFAHWYINSQRGGIKFYSKFIIEWNCISERLLTIIVFFFTFYRLIVCIGYQYKDFGIPLAEMASSWRCAIIYK